MANGNSNGNGQWRRRWQQSWQQRQRWQWQSQLQWQRPQLGRQWQREGCALYVPAMCSTVAGVIPHLHFHGHKGKCIHQRCIMGVTLLRVFAPPQGGGFLTAHHGFFFCLLFTTAVQFTEQPSISPPHYSGAQEPCLPIDALSPPLLHEPRQPIDNLPWFLLHFFSR